MTEAKALSAEQFTNFIANELRRWSPVAIRLKGVNPQPLCRLLGDSGLMRYRRPERAWHEPNGYSVNRPCPDAKFSRVINPA